MPNFGIKDLKEIFQSDGYRKELNELSSYAANIKQERLMLWLLSKHLNRAGFLADLEMGTGNKKYDLVVNDTTIEAKFYYECDLEQRLSKQIKKYQTIKNMRKRKKRYEIDRKSYYWTVAFPIIKDIFDKDPEIFIWIIVSRDLDHLSKNELNRICWKERQLKYNKSHGFNNKKVLAVASRFLEMIKKEKKFKYRYLSLNTTRNFPSIYHIHILDFRV